MEIYVQLSCAYIGVRPHIMKRKILYIILIISSLAVTAQTNAGIDRLIKRLSWNSITCDHSYIGSTVNYKDSTVNELIKIGKPCIKSLYNSIGDTNKTVIIHIILTNILEPENKTDFLAESHFYKDCNKIIGAHNIYNGLIWEFYIDSGFSVTKKEIDKIKNYWQKRINRKTQPWKPDVEELFYISNKIDSINYPCKKVYFNNSDKLNIKQLVNLIGTKFPSAKFDNIFNLLGNDSTISKYNDCTYLVYAADGIDFRFDKDGCLTTIFFKPGYKSELLYGVLITDTKEQLSLKLGNPNEKTEYNRLWYKDNKIGIDFYDDNTIKCMQIH